MAADLGDVDLIAGEYVLGTLDLDERTAFIRRLQNDDDARNATAAWERRFAGLSVGQSSTTPPSDAWVRIERAIDHPTAKMHSFKVIDGGGVKTDGSQLIRRSRDRWRLGALLTGTLAAALAIVVAGKVLRVEPQGETYVAAVNRGGDKPALIVRVDMRTGQVLVRPVAATAPAGHSLELWYIGADKTPRSMGVVADDTSHLSLPEGTATSNATFAISVEPPGGSKTGAPTGPVVYAGQLVKE